MENGNQEQKMIETARKRCKVPVRFYPGQEIFIPWINSNGDHVPSWLTQVDRVVWEDDSVTYEIQGLSNFGHQWLAEIKDTWDENCAAFETSEECQEYISKFRSDTYNGFDRAYFDQNYIVIPIRESERRRYETFKAD